MTSARFGDFAGIVAKRLGDRVKSWFTVAEPYTVMRHSYVIGDHAPGMRLPTGAALPVLHHLLLAHGLATAAIRGHSRQAGIGLTNPAIPRRPAPPRLSRRISRRMAGSTRSGTDYAVTDALLRGVIEGTGRSAGRRLVGGARRRFQGIIRAPVDWLGLTYFHPFVTGAPKARPRHVSPSTRL